MATKQTSGIAHMTVVPENFDPDADGGRADADQNSDEQASPDR